MKKFAFIFSLVLVTVLTLALLPANSATEDTEPSFHSVSDERIVIAADGATEYRIVFSSDAMSIDQSMATALRTKMSELYGVSPNVVPDVDASVRYEILIGNTDRPLSLELSEKISTASSSASLAWAYAYRDGYLAYTANSQEAFTYGQKEFFALLGDREFSVKEDLYVINTLTQAEYEAYLKAQEDRLEAEKEAEKQQLIQKLREENASYSNPKIGTSTAVFDATGYGKPHAYPTAGQHPRTGLADYMIEDIKRIMETEEMKYMTNLFWEYADTRTDGKLKQPLAEIPTSYNWDSNLICVIQAKALAYLLTEDPLYAQEAILAIKNYMCDLVMTTDAQGDLFYAYGTVMRVAAEVYDWCYPELTKKDRNDIIAGVENNLAKNMTIGCPPIKMNGISGHGTSSQLAMDYLAFSIAIYDERPDWYELVGARLYNEWYPFINFFQQSNYWNQGTATYADNKTAYQSRSAWIIKVMSGENPLPNLDNTIYGLLANELPNGRLFPSGDGTVGSGGVTYGAFTIVRSVCVLQAVYADERMQTLAKYFLEDYTKTQMTFSGYPYTATDILIWRSQAYDGEVDSANRYDYFDTVSYAPYPTGQMIARTSWNDIDAPVVFMRVNEFNLGNHEHEDSGTFQIYYKGLLTSSSGFYGSGEAHDAPYGSIHHRFYHQSTVSSNGILVYNPALSGDDPSVPSQYYYCGGQIESEGCNSYDEQMAEPTAVKGKTTGYDYEYKKDGVTPKYAYIAGDISEAYDSRTVESIERRMLAIFTIDADFPMLFYVFDNITSADAGFKKTFLLHTPNEPIVDGNRVTSVEGEGKLVLTSLKDGAEIEKIGGDGKWFLVNGRPCSPTENESNQWGRVEISVDGEKTTTMLHAMYVTDIDNTSHLETRLIGDTESCLVARTDRNVVVFCKDREKNSYSVSFENDGTGLFEYYVSGLSAGTWNVKVDGVSVANVHTEDESGLVTFVAPAGRVDLIPDANVKPNDSGIIKYSLAGAVLPEGTSEFYVYDEPFMLPTPVHPDPNAVFAGWYSDSTYSEPITEIPIGTRGTFRAYALYYFDYREDYSLNSVNSSAENEGTAVQTVGSFRYVTSGKTGASFRTVNDGDNTYLLWTKGELDPAFSIKKPLSDFLGQRNLLTFSFDVSANGDAPAIRSYLRLRGETSAHSVVLFWVQPDGRITLSNTNTVIATLTDEFTTVAITVDLESEIVYAYASDGKTIASAPLVKGDAIGEESLSDWAHSNTNYVFEWYASKQGSLDGAALRIDNFEITGEAYKKALVPPGDLAINYENLAYGSLPAKYPTSFTPGKGLSKLPTPVSDYFTFLGWYSDAEFKNAVTSIEKDCEQAITLYASWELSENIPEGTSVVIYDTGRGTYSEKYSAVNVGEALPLGIPVRDGCEFAGWYTSADFDKDCLVVGDYVPTKDGAVTLYAKFRHVFVEDYEGDFSVISGKEVTTSNGLKYVGTKAESRFETVKDGDNSYLLWTRGTQDSSFAIMRSLSDFLEGAPLFTLSLDLALCADAPPTRSYLMLRGTKSANSIPLFWIDYDGNVLLGEENGPVITTLTKEFRTVTVVVNFDEQKLYAVDSDGYIIAEYEFTYPADYATVYDYVDSCTRYIFHWTATTKNNENAQLCVDNITVKSGYAVDAPEKTTYIAYENVRGTLPSDAPNKIFTKDGLSELPVPTSDVFNFLGWYADKELTIPVHSIDAGTEGTVTLYAKWEISEFLDDGIAVVLYELYGGVYESDYTAARVGESVTLGIPVREDFTFLGWYTSDTFAPDSLVTDSFIPTVGGEVTLFARFEKQITVDYNNEDLDVNKTDQTVNSIKYVGSKADSSFKTVLASDSDANKYLLWVRGTTDSSFNYRKSLSSFLDGATKITYTVDVALNGDAPPTHSYLRIRGKSSAESIEVFRIQPNGKVTLGGDSGIVITALGEDFTTISVTVDFERNVLYATDDSGKLLEYTFKIPSAYSTAAEYIETCTTYLFDWYAMNKNSNAGSELRIDNIRITASF